MAMTPEEKSRLLALLMLMSQGSRGRSTLAAIQPILAIIEKQKAEEQAKRDASKAQRNATMGQVGNTLGSLGGMYLVGQALAPAAATTVATPALVGATTVGGTAATGAGAGAAGAGAAGAEAGGAAAAEAGAATTAGTSLGSVALPVAAAIATLSNAWESGGKDILRGRGDRSDWTNAGLNMTGYGALANMGLRLLGKRSLGAMMTSGKSNDQLMRDDFRGLLKNKGVVDKDYQATLADGTKFNLGLDGKTKYLNTDGKTQRNAWDVDWSNPLAKYAVDQIDPQIRGIYGNAGNKAHLEQYTGMIVNAVTSNAKTPEDVKRNIEAVFSPAAANNTGQSNATVSPAPSTPVTTPTPPPPAPPAQPSQPPIATRPPAPLPQGTPTSPLPTPQPPTPPTPNANVQVPPQAKPAPQGLLTFKPQNDQSQIQNVNLNNASIAELLKQIAQRRNTVGV